MSVADDRRRVAVPVRPGNLAQRERMTVPVAQLLQALVLDLPDALARDVERPPHLVEGARMLAVKPVAKLEHATLARREAAEHTPQRRLAELFFGDLVRESLVLVREEVPEFG